MSPLLRHLFVVVFIIALPDIALRTVNTRNNDINPHYYSDLLSDRRYPSFRNFNSTISIDVIWMKSYLDSLLDPSCVPVRVTTNKLNFFPNWKIPRFVGVLRNCRGLRTSKPCVSVVFFHSFLHCSPCFSDVCFAILKGSYRRYR